MLAYYAHSHGNGHLNYARLVAKAVNYPVLIITALQTPASGKYTVVRIADEDTMPGEYENALHNLPEYAHYLPKSNPKIVSRTKQIIDAVYNNAVNLAFIDVSVETAIIFRIASIPYAYCRMLGNRNDMPHTIAYKAAEFLFAYYPKQLEPESTPSWLLKHTTYLGFFSKFEYTEKHRVVEANPDIKGKRVLVICGNGGTLLTGEVINTIISKLEQCDVVVAGNVEGSYKDFEKNYLGYLESVEDEISKADVVISSCGLNLTSEILALKNKFIAFAEERPYQEQHLICEALARHNLAVKLDIDNVADNVKTLLALQPPDNLHDWFCIPGIIKKLEKQISHYEE